MSDKDGRKNVGKNMSEDMPENVVAKIHQERLYWTFSIELQAPRRLQTDAATAISA